MIPILTLKQTRSRRKDTNAPRRREGSEAEEDVIHIQGSPSPPPRPDLTTPAPKQAQQQIHIPAGMAGRDPERNPWLARKHPLGEGHGQACTVLRPVQRTEHGTQPRPKPQEQQQKPAPSPLRERDEGLRHQTRTQQASNIDSDSRPMRTALHTPRHHPFGGDYAKSSSNGQEGDTELTPWSAQYHPLGEGYGQACTVLGAVQGKRHRIQTLPNGHQQKCQIGCLIIILTLSILILRSTSRHFTRWRSRSWLNRFLVRWDLIFRDCQLEIQRYVPKSKLKPQTQRTWALDQVSISNERPPCRGRRPIRPRGLQIALYPALRLQQTTRFRLHQVAPTSYKSNTNCTDLSERKISLTWLITSTV